MALSSSTMRIRTAGSSGGIVRLLFESGAGADERELELTAAVLVTVFMWPSLQSGLIYEYRFV
jgi:hypothetical protein